MQSALRFAWLAAASLTAAAAPWMLGSEPLGAQWILLAGSLATLALGLARRLCADHRDAADRAFFRAGLLPLAAGAAFIALLGWQAGNHDLAVAFHGRDWDLVPVTPQRPGPTSIEAPFDGREGDFLPFRNASRYLLIFGAAFAWTAGFALGATHARDARAWAVALAANTAAIALTCLVHRASGATLTLWHYGATFDFTHSPVFLYKNHNGAWLAGGTALALLLAASARDHRSRTVGWAVAGLGWLATGSVNSRAAFAAATVTFGIALAGALRRSGWRPGRRGWTALAAAAVLGSAALLAAGGGRVLGRLAADLRDPGAAVSGGTWRSGMRSLAAGLWSDRPAFGWGGGSFVYLFPHHHARVPVIAAHAYAEQPTLNRLIGPTVNCDWWEFAVEYGTVGGLLLAASVTGWTLAWASARGWRNPQAFIAAAGAAGILGHGWYDYVLRNPAVLILFSGLLVTAARLAGPATPTLQDGPGTTGP